jgi:hypothetical protein
VRGSDLVAREDQEQGKTGQRYYSNRPIKVMDREKQEDVEGDEDR